jgi:long-subunit fatty acid transport protein
MVAMCDVLKGMQRTVNGFGVLAVVSLACVLILGIGSSANAQDFDSLATEALFQETINASFFGVDARAMGMGNTGVVSARDGSAMVYNPANLARIRRIEFRGGLSHVRRSNNTDLVTGGDTYSDGRDLNKTRISALSLVLPVPTYRGSLVFGLGLHRVNSFDRAFGARIPEPDLSQYVMSRGRELESGGLWKWTAAGAMDISPRVAVGLSLHLLTGEDDYSWTRYYSTGNPTDWANYLETINNDYIGVGATAGLNFDVSQELSVGFTIATPTYLEAEEHYYSEEEYSYSDTIYYEETYSDYSIRRPFTFAFGVSGSFDRLLLVGDLHYADWSQLEFNYDQDYLPTNREDQFIQDNLKEALSLNLGGEYLFPEQGINIRAGYNYDPLPIDNEFIESQRQYFTVGAGFLIDRVMTVDLAYVHGGYELRNADPGSFFSDYKTRKVFVTFAYRM